MTILIKNVKIYSGGGSAETGDIFIDGANIVQAGGESDRPADRVIDGQGKLAIPGLINAHFHSPVNHMKGMLDSFPLEIFMLYESPALDELRPTPREAYVRTVLGAMEMLRCGTTSVQDDAFFVPAPTPDIVDAVMQAYADTGIRARVALDQPNVAEIDKLPYLADLLPADLKARASIRSFLRRGRIAGRLPSSFRQMARRLRRPHQGRGLMLGAAARHCRLFQGARRLKPPPRHAVLCPHAGDEDPARASAKPAMAVRSCAMCPISAC